MSTIHDVPGFSVSTDAVASAAGAMLTKAAQDVTTNRLPKGTITAAVTAAASPSNTPEGSSSLESLQSIGLLELLELDDRPTLIVDLAAPPNSPPATTPLLQVLYTNPALHATDGLFDAIVIESAEHPEPEARPSQFTPWILANHAGSQDRIDIADLSTCDFAGMRWSSSTLRARFRIIYGYKIKSLLDKLPVEEPKTTVCPHTDGPAAIVVPASSAPIQDLPPVGAALSRPYSPDAGNSPEENELMNRVDACSAELLQSKMIKVEKPSFDWTRIPVTAAMPAHFKFARAVDWASTPLGDIEDWSDDLRTMSNMVMASPHPAAIYWGPEFVTIYNEAFIMLAGEKHPHLMGQPYCQAWAEISDEMEPIFNEARRSGLATMKHEDRLCIFRHGFFEEAWFSWSIIPLVGSNGSIVGLYNPTFEDTKRKIAERRIFTIREVGVQIATARDLGSFWSLVCKGLEFNEVDIPFALVYSVNEVNEANEANEYNESEPTASKLGKMSHRPILSLEGSIGCPAGHPASPKSIDLAHSDDGFAPYMRRSTMLGTPVLLRKENGTFPEALVEGVEWKGYGEDPHTISIFPVCPTTGCENPIGFVVLGTNPRRPFDQDFELFIHLLSRQLDTATASIILFGEEIKRGQRAERLAALDRQELQRLLHIQTQEAEASEYKFSRMAEFAPVGMFIANSCGDMSYCNDTWWELSRHPRSEDNIHTWMQSVFDEDRPAVEVVWQKLVNQKVSINHEFRFKYRREENGHRMDAWVLLSAFPQRGGTSHGIKSIFGCITDISQQKWAENVQIQRREEALELKRQQENFIDITSHEMRNPLSAVLQCADQISDSLAILCGSGEGTRNWDQVIDDCIKAADTISLCASHQKRIVDDILTLSKLDSHLLLVKPVDVQPVKIMLEVLKMFESELGSNEITAHFNIDESFRDLQIEWVKLDPSRLIQVLINLMTNAIKFTQTCEVRNITLGLGASRDITLSAGSSRTSATASHPSNKGIHFFPRSREGQDNLTFEPEWGTGEPISLHFSVKDSGEGLPEHDIKSLSQSFSQATPRTHVRYGGSGLGLFISRILIELQGGQIGVTSVKDGGSTFAFYIKSRKSKPPADKTVAKNTKDTIKLVTRRHCENTTALLASTNTHSTTPPPLSSTKPADPSILSAPSRDTVTNGLQQPLHMPPPPTVQKSTTSSPTPEPKHVSDGKLKSRLDILIVEDNLVNQKVLQKQLRNAGHNTQVANHGGEALQVIMRSKFWTGTPPPTPAPPTSLSSPSSGREETNPFDNIPGQFTSSGTTKPFGTMAGASDGNDNKINGSRPNISVVLMDLEMPVMDGMTCSRRIRELEATGEISRHLPIIAVTAYARPEQIEDAKAAGIDDVVCKPFRITELIPKIEQNIARWEDDLRSHP